MLLEVENIKKKFEKTEVLKGINFNLEKGQVLAIIGSSGSGKSTLLRSLNYLETPDEGKIIMDGVTIFDAENTDMSEDELRKCRLSFGLVFQNFNLFPHLNVLKNVTLATDLNLQIKLKEKQITRNEYNNSIEENKNNAKRLIEKVGLSDKLDAYPCQLSGGQSQRVAIARALALNPKILCFDEPTSALDPELTGEVLKVIKGLKDTESTMIVVTHEMEFARNVADKIIFMADGVIEEVGTPEEVFGNPKSTKTQAFLFQYAENLGG